MSKARVQEYSNINTSLSILSDNEIYKLMKGNQIGDGWGKNHIIKVDGKKLFVKSIPVTELELKNSFSTKNVFGIPTFYNYGVGSAGLGVFRELNLHVKTTNWVLNREIDGFPLMYHYRIVKKNSRAKKLSKKALEAHESYISNWNDSKRISNYILQRKNSEYELLVFLEYIPHVFMKWLKPNIGKFNQVSKKVFRIFDFLKSKGVIHFDAHFGNILTDGKEVYLTDFGLCLDKSFELSDKEKVFYKRHINYDYMEYIGCCSVVLESSLHDLTKANKTLLEDKIGLKEKMPYYEKVDLMLNNLDEVNKVMKLNLTYVQFLKKNLVLIKLSNNFFYELHKDKKKKLEFPSLQVNKELKKLKLV
jgi:serine/threonine protein kinase